MAKRNAIGLSALVGRDNAIDHSLSRTVNQTDGQLCDIPPGVEVEVPWDYPCGKETSGDVDPGRLGRDVSLVELVSGDAIDSAADYFASPESETDDDSTLAVAESQQEVDGNSKRPTAAATQLRRSTRNENIVQPNYIENSQRRAKVENGSYQMNTHDVCKQLAGIGCAVDDMEEHIVNLTVERRCYERMEKLQGEVVPKFLFFGKLADTSFWVCCP